jgi:phage terminase large subunit-like protein
MKWTVSEVHYMPYLQQRNVIGQDVTLAEIATALRICPLSLSAINAI